MKQEGGKNDGTKKRKRKSLNYLSCRISRTLVHDMQKHDYNPLASGQNRIQSPSFPLLPFPVVLSVLSMIRGVSSSHRGEIIKLTMSRSRLILPLPL